MSSPVARPVRPSRVPRAVLTVVAAATALAACFPFRGAAGRGGEIASADSAPVVQIREYRNSMHTTVVAWAPEEPQVGLRVDIRRDDGTRSGAPRRGDHLLFVGATYVQNMGGFLRAQVPPDGELLLTSSMRDPQACVRTSRRQCAPYDAVRFGIADSVVRRPADSLTVAFYSDWAEPWHVALRKDVVDAYLRTVDSITAVRRMRAGR